MKILQFPLARLTLFFLLGIVLARIEPLRAEMLHWILGLTIALFFIGYLLSQRYFKLNLCFGLAAALTGIAIGYVTQRLHSGAASSQHYMQFVTDSDTNAIEVILREQYKTTMYNERYIGVIQKINGRNAEGRILLNIKKDNIAKPFQIGTKLLLTGAIYPHQKPRNPGQFNYGNYLRNKNISAQMYLDRNAVKSGAGLQKDLWYYAAKFRRTILSNLKNSGFQQQELSVLAALILGQQQDIAPEILRDYQFAGAVHILSVSGLHVGLILVFLNFVLRTLPNTRAGAVVKIVVLLISLWAFAVIAGLSPSVVRSVTMFSFVAIGMHLRRSTNIFHTLLVSVFLILLFQPSFLTDVGFQLSYAALFFILWLQPMFSSLWQPKNKIVKYLWDIVTVSFAAQIGAFPLSAYYFHQFPGLFFVTNLIVLPFLSIIMAIGVVAVIIASFGQVPFALAMVLQTSIRALNSIISKIASFEQFVIQDIPFNTNLLITVYLVIITIFIWIQQPKFRNLCGAAVAILLFQISYIRTQVETQNQSELIVFHFSRNTLITQMHNAKATIFCSDTSINKTIVQSYLIENFSKAASLSPVPNVLSWQHRKILIVDSNMVVPFNHHPDVLLLTQSPKLNLDRILQRNKPEIVIADASNYKSYIESWRRTCEKKKIPFHATGEKGFYKME